MLRRQLGSAGKISQTSVPQTTIHAFMHAPPSTFMVTSQMQVAEEMVWELFTQAGPVGECTSHGMLTGCSSCNTTGAPGARKTPDQH